MDNPKTCQICHSNIGPLKYVKPANQPRQAFCLDAIDCQLFRMGGAGMLNGVLLLKNTDKVPAGRTGHILKIVGGGRAFQVEFCDGYGNTVAVPTVKAADLRFVGRRAASTGDTHWFARK